MLPYYNYAYAKAKLIGALLKLENFYIFESAIYLGSPNIPLIHGSQFSLCFYLYLILTNLMT